MDVSIHLKIALEKPEPPPPVQGDLFGRVRHDHEVWHYPDRAELQRLGWPGDINLAGQGMSRPEHIEWERWQEGKGYNVLSAGGFPETVKTLDSQMMPLTKAWQFFWFNLMRESVPNMPLEDVKRAWASLTKTDRAFTNKKGWNEPPGYADYINNVNPTARPMMQETIVTGGTLVKVLDKGQLHQRQGVPCYKVETLDGTRPPPAISRATHPWYIFFATNSTRQAVRVVERMVNPFPQLKGWDVPVPFMGPGPENFIEAVRIELLPAGAGVPDPYNR